MTNQTNRQKIKTGAVALSVCLIMPFAWMFILASNPTNESEKIIKEAIAEQLNKNPTELTNDDYKKVLNLELQGDAISDISTVVSFASGNLLVKASILVFYLLFSN